MPDRYIDWAKIEEKKTVTAVLGDERSVLKEENRELQNTVAQLREQQSQMVNRMDQINSVMNVLIENPGLQDQLKALASKANETKIEKEIIRIR